MAMLMYWTHSSPAPWQTPEWREQMRQQLRPNAYLRLIENRFVTSESTFVPIEWFDACVDPDLSPALTEPSLAIWVGVDASVKRDSTAIVAATFDHTAKKVRLVWHRIFQPSPKHPLDFERTVEKSLLDLRRRFRVREVRFDPYQLVAVAQRLTAAGLPMIEFPQSVPNLTEASTNLYELLKGRNLVAYADDDLLLAVSRCVALEDQPRMENRERKAVAQRSTSSSRSRRPLWVPSSKGSRVSASITHSCIARRRTFTTSKWRGPGGSPGAARSRNRMPQKIERTICGGVVIPCDW